jgi:transcriptional regulator with XRE-family HTH domain
MIDLEAIRRKRDARRALFEPAFRRALRLQAGLSQQDIADAVGVRRETISRWERGVRSPRGESLNAYARVLGAIAEPLDIAKEHLAITQPGK